jgi:hypothetical protein
VIFRIGVYSIRIKFEGVTIEEGVRERNAKAGPLLSRLVRECHVLLCLNHEMSQISESFRPLLGLGSNAVTTILMEVLT